MWSGYTDFDEQYAKISAELRELWKVKSCLRPQSNTAAS